MPKTAEERKDSKHIVDSWEFHIELQLDYKWVGQEWMIFSLPRRYVLTDRMLKQLVVRYAITGWALTVLSDDGVYVQFKIKRSEAV